MAPPPCLSWSRVDLLPSPHSSTTMSLLVPSGSPSFTSLLHHHVSLGPQRVSVIHLIPPSPCLSWFPAGLRHSPHSSITMSLLVQSGSPSFTSLLHHHVSLGPQRVSVIHLIPPSPCLSWFPAGLLPSPHYSTTMSLLGPSGPHSFTTLLHHHVSLGPQRVSFLHHITPPPCLSWAPVGLLPSPHCSTTMSLLGASGSPSFTSLLHHHVSLGPQRASFLHHIAPPPCLSWAPAGLLPSPHCSTTMSLLVPSGSSSFTPLLHHHVSPCPQWVSFVHLIAPQPCLSWSPAGLLPSHHYSTTMSLLVQSGSPSSTSLLHHHVALGPQQVSFLHPHCSTTMSILVTDGSPSFTSLLHHHVSLDPQRVSFLHPIAPPPCLSWSPRISFLHIIAPPPCRSWSPAGLLLHPIAPPPCISLSPAGLLRSPHCSTTMSFLVPSGSPSFTSLLHHHVSPCPQRVSFVHLIAPPPCPYWSPAGLLRSHHCSTTMSLLVPSGSPSFTTLLHHHVSLGPEWISFLHLIAPPCLSWSPAGLLPSPHCSTTMSLLIPSGSPSFNTLLHHRVYLDPQLISFLNLITPPPCLS